jgi:hypothetical protein
VDLDVVAVTRRWAIALTTLVTTNDFHSAVVAGRPVLAQLRRWRARGAVVIDSWDFFGGNAFHEFSRGRPEERLLLEFYHAIVPGNHDLAPITALAHPDRFPPVVCANLRPATQPPITWASTTSTARRSSTKPASLRGVLREVAGPSPVDRTQARYETVPARRWLYDYFPWSTADMVEICEGSPTGSGIIRLAGFPDDLAKLSVTRFQSPVNGDVMYDH